MWGAGLGHAYVEWLGWMVGACLHWVVWVEGWGMPILGGGGGELEHATLGSAGGGLGHAYLDCIVSTWSLGC